MFWVFNGKIFDFTKRSMKMGILLNVQLSVFGNYHIDTKPDNITTLMEKLNQLGRFEFLPNVVNGQNIDLLGGKVNIVSNLSFITATRQCQIMCMDERIDCTINYNADTQETIDSALDFTNSVLNVIMDTFPILGNRLAINVNKLGEPYEGDIKSTRIGEVLVSNLPYYQDKELVEWSSRSNTQMPVSIGEKEEVLNVISELNIATNNQTQEKTMLCHIDFNTVPQNTGFRFNNEHLTEFVVLGKEIISQLIGQFEGLSSCD